jgi:hypothetical protein
MILTDAGFVELVVALLAGSEGRWSGTATELLALNPEAAADPTRLARRLGR